jgi:hypothetical protein
MAHIHAASAGVLFITSDKLRMYSAEVQAHPRTKSKLWQSIRQTQADMQNAAVMLMPLC